MYILLYFTILTLLIIISIITIYYLPKKIYNLKLFNYIRNNFAMDISMKVLYLLYSIILSIICFSIIFLFAVNFNYKKEILIEYDNNKYCFRLLKRLDDDLILFFNNGCNLVKSNDDGEIFIIAKDIKNIYIEDRVLNIIISKNSKFQIHDKNIIEISKNYFKNKGDGYGNIKYVKLIIE